MKKYIGSQEQPDNRNEQRFYEENPRLQKVREHIDSQEHWEDELQEIIENGLQSTGRIELEHCSDLATTIILMMKQEGFRITKI